MLRNAESGIMEEIQWEDAMDIFRSNIDNKNLNKDLIGLVGEFNSCESLTVFRDFMHKLNCEDFACHNYHFKSKVREDYLMNRTIGEIE